jgi:hypothetical protein
LKTDRDLKKIIPLYTFGALDAYTEDTFYEADKYLTKEGKKIITFEAHLGFLFLRCIEVVQR